MTKNNDDDDDEMTTTTTTWLIDKHTNQPCAIQNHLVRYGSDSNNKGNDGASMMGWPVEKATCMVLEWRPEIGLSKKTVERDNTTINRAQYDSDGNVKGDGGTIDKRWQSWRDDDNDDNNIDDDYNE